MANRVFGITGMAAAGKTCVALALCKRHNAVYCSAGAVYLALVELLHQSGWDLQRPLIEAQRRWIVQKLTSIRLGYLPPSESGLRQLAACSGETPLPAPKNAQRATCSAELASILAVNLKVLDLVRNCIAEVTICAPIVLDGRQAYLVTGNSVFLKADIPMRVERLRKKLEIRNVDAAALIQTLDNLDRCMNDDAQRVLIGRVIDATELSPFHLVEAAERCLGLTHSWLQRDHK